MKIKYVEMYSGSIHYQGAYFLSVTDTVNFVLFTAKLVHI